MAVEATVAERAYIAIKAKLFAGAFLLRQRLDATAIAGELGMSTTPVREALVRLTAERLIAIRPAHGYHVTLWSERQLGWLYAWRAQLAELASAALGDKELSPPPSAPDYTLRVSATLQRLHHEGNPELLLAAEGADDRLNAARRAERELWSDADAELASLELTLVQGKLRSRGSALKAYHQRRLKAVRLIRERAVLMATPQNGK